MKRKKRYETQLQQIDGTLTTLEYQRESLEKSLINLNNVLNEIDKSTKVSSDFGLLLEIQNKFPFYFFLPIKFEFVN